MSRRPNVITREKILETAYDLFHAGGFKGVSMDAIAAGTGIKKANLFHYYSTKDELTLAVFDHATCSLKKKLSAQFSDGEKDPVATVEKMFSDIEDCMRDSRCSRGCFVGNLAQEMSDHHEVLRQKISGHFQYWAGEIAQFLNRWRERAYFQPDFNAAKAGESIVALFEGAVLFSKAEKRLESLENAKDMASRYLRSYRNPQGGKNGQ